MYLFNKRSRKRSVLFDRLHASLLCWKWEFSFGFGVGEVWGRLPVTSCLPLLHASAATACLHLQDDLMHSRCLALSSSCLYLDYIC